MMASRIVVTAAVAALFLAACSSSSDEEDYTAPSTTAPATIEQPEGGQALLAPDGTEWSRSGDDQVAYQRDVEACYNYAWSQTEHDYQIEDDRDAGFGDNFFTAGQNSGYTKQQRPYDNEQHRREAFVSCMNDRGYDEEE